ncbi:MAG: hypothetical protein ACK4S4_09865 [Pyrinomonadaceae bacterium]
MTCRRVRASSDPEDSYRIVAGVAGDQKGMIVGHDKRPLRRKRVVQRLACLPDGRVSGTAGREMADRHQKAARFAGERQNAVLFTIGHDINGAVTKIVIRQT